MPRADVVRVFYDDQPDQVADRFAAALEQFGVRVEVVNECEGVLEYKLSKSDE